MSVERRTERSGRAWRVRWREEGRNRSRSFTRRRDAEAFEVANRRRLEIGGPGAEPSRITLDDWIERWIGTHGPGWAASTRAQRAWTADRHLSPRLGAVRLRELTRARLRSWRRDLLDAGASPHAVNSASRVLSAALSAAADEELIASNPLLGMRSIPQGPRERRPVPLAIVETIRAAMPEGRDRRVVDLMAYAGLRPGEVRALRWSDVDAHTLWVGRAEGTGGLKTTKTGGGRSVPIRDELRRDLQAGEGLVCPGDRGGVLDWHNWAARIWRPACDAADSRHVPYELRHTYASLLIAEGASVVEVAAAMGHASPVTTLAHYARLLDSARPPGGRIAR